MNEKLYNLVLEGKLEWDELHKMLITFNTALAAAQAEVKTIDKNTKAHNWTFAPWPKIRNETQAVLAKHGLFIQHYHHGDNEALTLTVIIGHNSSGYEEIYHTPILFNRGTSKGGKLEHEVQGAITYYKRSTYIGLLCIATDDEDSEVEKASAKKNKNDSSKEQNQDYTQQKGQEDSETCPKCSAPMVLKTSSKTGKQFWGCTTYRDTGCKGYKSL